MVVESLWTCNVLSAKRTSIFWALKCLNEKFLITNRTRRTKAGIALTKIPEPVLNFGSLHTL